MLEALSWLELMGDLAGGFAYLDGNISGSSPSLLSCKVLLCPRSYSSRLSSAEPMVSEMVLVERESDELTAPPSEDELF
jgi:hypothetical protein